MPSSAAATVARVGERTLIERIRARVPAPPPWVLAGIGDDAAVVRPARNLADVATTDALIEHVHFDRAYVPAGAVGFKALAVNLSDLAAMGALPRAALLSLALPDAMLVADLDDLVDEMLALAARHRVELVGGNIARSPGPLFIGVTAIGAVHPRRVLRRSGARPGDTVWVSGTLGNAAAGFQSLRAAFGFRRPCREVGAAPVDTGPDGDLVAGALAMAEGRFLRPDPRVRLGLLLARNRLASSAVDLSDGLAEGLRQLAGAADVGLVVDAEAVPIDEGARNWFRRQGVDPIEAAVSGGEDYELLFTLPPRRQRAFDAARPMAGTTCTRIGRVTPGRELVLMRDGARQALPPGFAHFR